jgi:hypothetical protein
MSKIDLPTFNSSTKTDVTNKNMRNMNETYDDEIREAENRLAYLKQNKTNYINSIPKIDSIINFPKTDNKIITKLLSTVDIFKGHPDQNIIDWFEK